MYLLDQMLAASEAKQNLKDLTQEQEDLERYNRMKAAAAAATTASSSS